ncbi:Cell division protein DedD [Serratia symbiotica]|nr:Cell division protein DedD [Serratia symbiotica]
MATKFRNRIVGTIVFLSLGAISLPVLLDSKQNYYENEFTPIPLEPNQEDVENKTTLSLPGNERLFAPLPMPSEALVEHQANLAKVVQQAGEQKIPLIVRKPTYFPTAEDVKQGVKPNLVSKYQLPSSQEEGREHAPVGLAYVVQLGALKNTCKVGEIVAALRLSGYHVFTSPSTPVQGKLTRIYVGPGTSKQELQSSLTALNAISGLKGYVNLYSLR